MKEFKVGDRVRFIGTCDGYGFENMKKAVGKIVGVKLNYVLVNIKNDIKFDPNYQYAFRYNMIKKSSCIANFIRRFWRVN